MIVHTSSAVKGRPRGACGRAPVVCLLVVMFGTAHALSTWTQQIGQNTTRKTERVHGPSADQREDSPGIHPFAAKS